MVGDNDAGAFGTYTQAGQNYGTTLLWTLALLIPVLYVNQEMVLRLGAVSGVGHARLILERFGKFWGAFSVIDLFLLNALTIVTEFIGISLALDHLGLPKLGGVLVAAALIMIAAATGSFRRFERFSLVLVVGSLLLVPVFLMVHPPVGQMAADFFVPKLPEGSAQGSRLREVMLLPSAAVFLLLLCNDKAVLGPWVNGRGLNFFTGAVIAVLVMLSIILTASVLFPEIDSETIIAILVAGGATALVIYLITPGEASAEPADPSLRDTWRMPPLANLPPRHLTTLNRTWLLVLRAYLIVAAGLVLVRIVTLATSGD